MRETPRRDLTIPAKIEEYIKECAPEFLVQAVASAKKPSFAVKCMAKPITTDPDCYSCEHCHRVRYLKGGWYCRKYKPGEPREGLTCFVRRGKEPNCFDCAWWRDSGNQCMCEESQWAGCTTSSDNYCRHFERWTGE